MSGEREKNAVNSSVTAHNSRLGQFYTYTLLDPCMMIRSSHVLFSIPPSGCGHMGIALVVRSIRRKYFNFYGFTDNFRNISRVIMRLATEFLRLK